MKLRNIVKPIYVIRRLALMVYEWRHPDHPWIASGAIDYCARELSPEMRALEWGSGRSTAWWARHVGSLLSVEQDQKWYDIVSEKLKSQRLTNVDYRWVPVDEANDGGYLQDFKVLPPYVAVADEFEDESLDFVVVDGHYRRACVRAVLSKIKVGGLLLIDNFNWMPPEDWEIPKHWLKVCDSSNALTQTTIWKKQASVS